MIKRNIDKVLEEKSNIFINSIDLNHWVNIGLENCPLGVFCQIIDIFNLEFKYRNGKVLIKERCGV